MAVGKTAMELRYLLDVADADLSEAIDNSVLAQIMAKGGDISDFSSTTDSLEALAEAIALMGTPAGAAVLGALADAAAAGAVTDVDTAMSYLKQIVTATDRNVGAPTSGMAITQTLYVSAAGSGSDGLSWPTAFNTVPEALDAASTEASDCTLILVAPNTPGGYDMDTAGDPTWAANVIIQGTYRTWTRLFNSHASATSILKLTGKSGVASLHFDLGATDNNGLIMTSPGALVKGCFFTGTALTGAATALEMASAAQTLNHRVEDCEFIGHVTYMTALKLSKVAYSVFKDLKIGSCLKGIHITDALSDANYFINLVLDDCAIGLDVDAGNEQNFISVRFSGCTVNIDDEVGDHLWVDVFGTPEITSHPDNLTGISVPAHANPATWGADTELRSAATATAPFIILGLVAETSASEKYRIRLSADSGATFFDDIFIDVSWGSSILPPAGLQFVFNAGTRISASCMSESGANTMTVWIKVQEI